MTTETKTAARRAALRDLVTAGGRNDAAGWQAAQERMANLADSPPSILFDRVGPSARGNAAVERDLATVTMQPSSI